MALRLFHELYYMAHHENLGSIAERGILSHSLVGLAGVEHVDISEPGAQQWRALPEPVFGASIHAYVPLYFNPRNPMLYSRLRQQRVLATVHLSKRTVWSLSEARASLERLVGIAEDWSCLDEYLLRYVIEPSQKATVFASSFAAALELVREGSVDLHQKEAFAPLYFRKRPAHLPPDAQTAPEVPVE